VEGCEGKACGCMVAGVLLTQPLVQTTTRWFLLSTWALLSRVFYVPCVAIRRHENAIHRQFRASLAIALFKAPNDFKFTLTLPTLTGPDGAFRGQIPIGPNTTVYKTKQVANCVGCRGQ
jgi:hypothetical protein